MDDGPSMTGTGWHVTGQAYGWDQDFFFVQFGAEF